ncbi:cytochrome C oxidase subunit IV family protein, partial [Candidatus Gracilibacteria bacterium]|nr:cytochrome C oxidase subunit IV family protein [Candidatus Gracilibacteria bacterium]
LPAVNRANTLVWILLVGLTLLSFALRERHLPSAALFLVAAAKAWFVARHFMELATPPPSGRSRPDPSSSLLSFWGSFGRDPFGSRGDHAIPHFLSVFCMNGTNNETSIFFSCIKLQTSLISI